MKSTKVEICFPFFVLVFAFLLPFWPRTTVKSQLGKRERAKEAREKEAEGGGGLVPQCKDIVLCSYQMQCDQTLRFSAKPADFEGLLRICFEILI